MNNKVEKLNKHTKLLMIEDALRQITKNDEKFTDELELGLKECLFRVLKEIDISCNLQLKNKIDSFLVEYDYLEENIIEDMDEEEIMKIVNDLIDIGKLL